MAVDFNATFSESNQFGASFAESSVFGAGFGATVIINTVLPSDDLPLMDGDASPGTSRKYARGDHRHPHDDSKQDYMSALTNAELEALLR